MEFLLSEELKEYRGVLRKFFATQVPLEFVKERLLQGEDGEVRAQKNKDPEAKRVWSSLVETGALSAAIPEEYDGLGFGIPAAAVLLEESARVLLPLPLAETVSLGILPLLLFGTEDAKKTYLPKIAEGNLTLSSNFLFHPNEMEGERLKAETLQAEKNETDKAAPYYQLSGVLPLVPSANEVGGLLCLASAADGTKALYFVDFEGQSKDAVAKELENTFDLLRPYYRVRLKGARAELLSVLSLSETQLSEGLEKMASLSAFELVGAAERVFEDTIEYVKTRKQFGKPIGSFQAVQHALAESYVSIQEIAALGRCAAAAPDDLSSASAFRALACERVPELLEKALQVHGGIGFTWEYQLHLYLRRAKTLSSMSGGYDSCYERLAVNLVSPA